MLATTIKQQPKRKAGRPDDVEALIAACRPTDVQAKAYLDLAFHSGLRPQELCDLRWEDVTDKHVFVRNGKGGQARRSILTKTYGWVERHRQLSGGTGFVFTTKTGKPWHVSHTREIFTRLSARIETNLAPHSLRHGHACEFYKASGNDIVATSRQLGHSSIAVTDAYLKGLELNDDSLAELEF